MRHPARLLRLHSANPKSVWQVWERFVFKFHKKAVVVLLHCNT